MTQVIGSPVVPDDAYLGALWSLLKRRRRMLVITPAIFMVIAFAWALLKPRSYTSLASFLPQKSDLSRSGLGALASQLGVNLSLDQTGQSPAFYAALLQTPELLGAVVDGQYQLAGGPDSVSLAQALRVTGRNPALVREFTIRRLRDIVDIRVDQSTDIVRLFVTTRSAALSQQVATRLLDEVNRFNVERRRTRASAERQFADDRRRQAQEEMKESEARLQRFLEGNRNYTNAPALVAENERLRREVSLRQQVYTTLTQAYEQARIDEVRNTPVITVVEHPQAPVRPDSRRAVNWLAVSLVLGVLCGLAAAIVLDTRGSHFVWGSIPRSGGAVPGRE